MLSRNSIIVVLVLLGIPALHAARAAGEDFTLTDINGIAHTLSDYRGKWVVVNYWATWCPPCREEIPQLIRFYDQHKGKDAVVLGLNYEDISLKRLRAFVAAHAINYPVIHLGVNATLPIGPVTGFPTTYVISPQGEVVGYQLGGITAGILNTFIRHETAAQRKAQAPQGS